MLNKCFKCTTKYTKPKQEQEKRTKFNIIIKVLPQKRCDWWWHNLKIYSVGQINDVSSFVLQPCLRILIAIAPRHGARKK